MGVVVFNQGLSQAILKYIVPHSDMMMLRRADGAIWPYRAICIFVSTSSLRHTFFSAHFPFQSPLDILVNQRFFESYISSTPLLHKYSHSATDLELLPTDTLVSTDHHKEPMSHCYKDGSATHLTEIDSAEQAPPIRT